jgi:hypothetical protein
MRPSQRLALSVANPWQPSCALYLTQSEHDHLGSCRLCRLGGLGQTRLSAAPVGLVVTWRSWLLLP